MLLRSAIVETIHFDEMVGESRTLINVDQFGIQSEHRMALMEAEKRNREQKQAAYPLLIYGFDNVEFSELVDVKYSGERDLPREIQVFAIFGS